MPRPRQSNLELLRIFAILMVVMGHFIRQSGLLESETGINSTLNVLFGSGGRIAVNVFLLIGSWFMVDSTFRPGKALRLYLETAFYCIPITILMICLGTAGGTRNILQGLLPFFGRPVWFASAYISLILLTPFLNNAFLLPTKKLTYLTVALFILFCITSTIPCFSTIDYIADLSWFCVLYLIVGWAKKIDILGRLIVSKWVYAIAGILIYAGLCFATKVSVLTWTANYWIDNIRTLPNIACAVCIFCFFLKSNIGYVKLVNFFARSVFAVYIVHQVPAFREFEWNTICHAHSIAGLPPSIYALSICGISMSLLIAVTIIDLLKIKLFTAVESHFLKESAE